MYGSISPLPNTPSCLGVQLKKKKYSDSFTLSQHLLGGTEESHQEIKSEIPASASKIEPMTIAI
jgi:hypothetical protein